MLIDMLKCSGGCVLVAGSGVAAVCLRDSSRLTRADGDVGLFVWHARGGGECVREVDMRGWWSEGGGWVVVFVESGRGELVQVVREGEVKR
jgi:hypothetical protein